MPLFTITWLFALMAQRHWVDIILDSVEVTANYNPYKK